MASKKTPSSKKASKKTVAKKESKKKIAKATSVSKSNGKRLRKGQRRFRCELIIEKLQPALGGIGLEKKSAIEAKVRELVDATLKPLSL